MKVTMRDMTRKFAGRRSTPASGMTTWPGCWGAGACEKDGECMCGIQYIILYVVILFIYTVSFLSALLLYTCYIHYYHDVIYKTLSFTHHPLSVHDEEYIQNPKSSYRYVYYNYIVMFRSSFACCCYI